MIDNHGEVKIIDFSSCHIKGIAEIISPLGRDKTLGKAGYYAQEVVIAAPSSVQSEVFSVSVIVYEPLIVQEPFNCK